MANNHIDYSYESKITGVRSLLDHFILTENLFRSIVSAEVYHNGDNLSDHDAISVCLNISVTFMHQTIILHNAKQFYGTKHRIMINLNINEFLIVN